MSFKSILSSVGSGISTFASAAVNVISKDAYNTQFANELARAMYEDTIPMYRKLDEAKRIVSQWEETMERFDR